ncbi:hypothetical protein KIN20_037297 [Parelaphostrongylus tenuis]|uniref:Uncharacterized protein n=1 Tax=Parelaphostrongylus tenuis TaxID=148309 RepID=A0AAD5WM02_PARTN|nr:hypothetical protein KIN20_037297 [Parelaphostrongylus tenuis]
MTTAQSNAEVISSMERQYAEQKAKFEKWKIDNSRQVGTESYNKYVQQFLQWEKEVFEKKAKVAALVQSEASSAIAGPANVDSILGQLLDDVLPMEFLMALVTVHMKDNTFLPCVIENFRKAQLGELTDQSKLLVTTTPQYHHNIAPTPQFYHHVTTTPHTSIGLRPSTASTVVAWPTSAPPVGPKYRPPSPVRDYKNPVANIPFRDFIVLTLLRRVRQCFSDDEEDEQEKTSLLKPTEPVTKPATKTPSQSAPVETRSSRAKSERTQVQSLKSMRSSIKFRSKAEIPTNRERRDEISSSKKKRNTFMAAITRRRASKSDLSSKESKSARIRQLSERAVRKVKTFVSRPIKETTMLRFVSKVEAKKQAEESGKMMEHEMKLGDDPFPKLKSRGSKSREFDAQDHKKDRPDIPELKSTFETATTYRHGNLPSGCRLVVGNKNNNGKLIIDEKPFWMEQRKPSDEDLEDSGTDDDLQMTAEVALDVYEGKVKLVDMPTIPIILDPMNELRELQRRDKLFYTRDVLFGNSIRSMINLCDNSSSVTPIKRRSRNEYVKFKEPSIRHNYLRGCLFNIVEEPFVPKSKKKS